MSPDAASTKPTNPYPGLRPYEITEYESFFGRDREVDELLIRLRDHRFVAVVGLSGSGKSSLVRAGLIRKLSVGHLVSGGRRWRCAVFRPGPNPIAALGSALDAQLGLLPQRADLLMRNTQELIRSTREGRAPDESLLLVVDQFEEIFRFQREKNLSFRTASHFVNLLLAAGQDLSPDYRVYVVLTMRSDSLGDAAWFEGLPEALNKSQYLVPRMSRDQLAEAIVGPAALTDTEVAPELVQRLLTQGAEGDDHLPLLQHLLTRLWDRRTPTGAHGNYSIVPDSALKGPVEALNLHAEELLKNLGSDERRTEAQRIFQQLTEMHDGRERRRPTRLSKLAELTNIPRKNVESVVQPFIDASFLTSPDQGVTADWEVDIVHECLIRQWKTLRTWAQAEAAAREEYREFARRAVRGQVLTGVDLDLALRWLVPGYTAEWSGDARTFEVTVAFIHRSREAKEKADQEDASRLAREEEDRRTRQVREIEERQRAADEAIKERQRRRERVFMIAAIVVAVAVGAVAINATRQLWEANIRNEESTKRLDDAKVAEAAARLGLTKAEAAGDSARQQALVNDAARQQAQQASDAAKRETELLRWQALAVASSESASQDLFDRAALLARESFLRTRNLAAPGREIQQALIRAGSLTAFGRCAVNPGGASQSVAFSPTGATVASGTRDGMIRFWDVNQSALALRRRDQASRNVFLDRTPYFEFNLDEPLNVIAISADGSILAGGGSGRSSAKAGPVQGTIRLWNLKPPSSKPVVIASGLVRVASLSISPDGNALAAAFGSSIKVWNPKQPNQPPREFTVQNGEISDVAISRTDILAAAIGGTIRTWTLTGPGASPTDLEARREDVDIRTIDFSPDGRRIAAGTTQGDLMVWDLVNPGRAPTRFPRHQEDVYSVVFSPDGRLLASASWDDTIRISQADEPARVPLIIEAQQEQLNSIAFSSDGRQIVSGGVSDKVCVWDLPDNMTPRVLTGHENAVVAAAFSPDGGRLASASSDGVRLWDLRDFAKQPVLLPHQNTDVNAVAFARDGGTLASGDNDGKVRIWNLTGPTKLAMTVDAGSAVYALAFLSDIPGLAVGTEGGLFIWTLASPVTPGNRTVLWSGLVASLAVSRNGHSLASGDERGEIRIWDLRQPARVPRVLNIKHRDVVLALAFSPDGTQLASGSADQTMRLWDLTRPAALPEVFSAHSDAVTSVAFSPDGRWLASASWDRTVLLWDLQDSKRVPVHAETRPEDVNVVRFSPDGSRLAIGSDDGRIKLVDLGAAAADSVCGILRRNLLSDEWRAFIGPDYPYRQTCSNLPPGPSRNASGK